MKVSWKFLIILVIIGLAGGAFYFYKQKNSKKNATLETVYPTTGNIVQTITATGRLQPIDQVDVGTEVSGTVSKIYADFNQQVEKGQVLLQIDPLKAKARVQQTRAAYRSAENERQYQKRIYERTLELFEKGSIAKTELETAEYRYINAQNSLINSKSNLEQAELDLNNCTIKSPIDGIVLSRAVEAGQTVAASLSAPTLFTLARDLTQMEVKADVDEADIGMVKMGQKVEFSVDAFPNDKFTGEVQEVRLSPNISSNVVTYTVIIKANNPEQKLLPGMTANCNIIVEEVLQVLTIPLRALQFKPDENTPGYVPPSGGEAHFGGGRDGGGKRGNQSKNRVWVHGVDGSVSMKRVSLGLSDGAKIQVLDGVDAATSIVVGVQIANEKSGQATTSPFMPQRNTKGGIKTRM
ncbi:MAG: efflux RND transporter periplasmic adaptor subunit [Fibromonadaceae bacterium]|jgi:HlyD family secretion protein|nr:efflux RND transporter periplasmic adaptor subunit [Fibromonadaceae bacterium]